MNHDQQTHRRHDAGRKVYVVGPIERWIIGLAAAAIVGLGVRLVSQVDTIQQTSSRIELAQAVTNSEMTEIKAKQQLMQIEVAKIPRLEVQVQANTEALKEHRQMKNLK